jgi:hypothetical protein
MQTGEKDRLVQFYPLSVSEDALGVEAEADGTPVAAWAKVLFGTGAERREAGAAGSAQTATFRVDSCSALRAATERWEIAFADARWGITSISPVGAQGREIEFVAVKKGA